MSQSDKRDHGFYHLTPTGWVRQDLQPFPADRVETWVYEMECPAEDAKDRVCLTRTWINPGASGEQRDALRKRYAAPMTPTPDRNVTLECLV